MRRQCHDCPRNRKYLWFSAIWSAKGMQSIEIYHSRMMRRPSTVLTRPNRLNCCKAERERQTHTDTHKRVEISQFHEHLAAALITFLFLLLPNKVKYINPTLSLHEKWLVMPSFHCYRTSLDIDAFLGCLHPPPGTSLIVKFSSIWAFQSIWCLLWIRWFGLNRIDHAWDFREFRQTVRNYHAVQVMTLQWHFSISVDSMRFLDGLNE